MPAVIAAPWLGTAIAGVAGGAATIAAGKMGANAARRGAEESTRGANYAADRQLEASREAERFARQQAQQQWAQQEADRRANYDQWVARERRLGSIAEQLGYGRREIPGYVPSVDPRYVGSGQTPGAAQNGPPVNQSMPVRDPRAVQPGGAPAPMSARDVILNRRFPAGTVGAMVLARQRRPMGAGV